MSVSKYLMCAIAEAERYLDEIVDEMMERFHIPVAEAVARVNHHWAGQDFDSEGDLLFHEMPEFWADLLYYGADAHHEATDADRSAKRPVAPPPGDSLAWALGQR